MHILRQNKEHSTLPTKQETDSLDKIYQSLIQAIGEDPQREGLLKTPQRAAKAFRYITRGYQQNIEEIINQAIFISPKQDMVIVKDIPFYSICEHHLLPFFGKCHVGYIPNGKVIGLSKIPRIVDVFARRLQIQENLTRQIASAIATHTECHGIGVIIEAQHLCVMMRGVEKHQANAKTSCFLGNFESDRQIRSEFFQML